VFVHVRVHVNGVGVGGGGKSSVLENLLHIVHPTGSRAGSPSHQWTSSHAGVMHKPAGASEHYGTPSEETTIEVLVIVRAWVALALSLSHSLTLSLSHSLSVPTHCEGLRGRANRNAALISPASQHTPLGAVLHWHHGNWHVLDVPQAKDSPRGNERQLGVVLCVPLSDTSHTNAPPPPTYVPSHPPIHPHMYPHIHTPTHAPQAPTASTGRAARGRR
jgi:hypothetical protein